MKVPFFSAVSGKIVRGLTMSVSEGSTSPKRPRLDDELSKEDPHEKYKNREQDDQGSQSNSRKRKGDTDEDDMKDCDELKSKSMGGDVNRREHTLVMRLTNKEQELQECMNQMQEMKQLHTQNTYQLRSMLLDPAINLVFQRMSKEMEEHKEKLKQKQNELNAWKFTPDSHTGMRLMGKCRMLLQENGDLGKMISSGRTARLEGEISLHKALVAEMRKNQKELDEFVGELEEDVEGMQGLILMLQQQLKESKEQITRLQQENEELRTLQSPADSNEPCGSVKNEIHSDNANRSSSTSSSQISSSLSSTDHSHKQPTLLVPQSNSNDSALTYGSTDDFSPNSCAIKVTPDSGIQTQEEDEDMADSTKGDDVSQSNQIYDCPSLKSHSPTPKAQNERTTNCHDSLNPALTDNSDSTFPKRTSPHVTSANGDTQVTENECVNGEKRTSVNDLKEKNIIKEEIEDAEELTNNSSNDKIEDLSECLGLNEECPVNSF